MRGDTFISFWFLDQILSADFISKLYKLFGVENWHQSSYFDTLPSLLSFLKLPLGGAKDEHFSFFQRSFQLGLRPQQLYNFANVLWKRSWMLLFEIGFDPITIVAYLHAWHLLAYYLIKRQVRRPQLVYNLLL